MIAFDFANEVFDSARALAWQRMIDQKGDGATVFVWPARDRSMRGFRADFKGDGTCDIHAVPIQDGSPRSLCVPWERAKDWLVDTMVKEASK